MKIIVSPDSFKGSLTAIEAANSIERGVKNIYKNAETRLLPVGDGGEGTMDSLIAATDGYKKKAEVIAPLGNEIEASYGVLGDEKTCVIEMATASGIDLVSEYKLSPLNTTTYGTGQLIKQALDEGYTSFIISIGGSATNDGGAGMLQALGLQLLNDKGNEITFGGGALSEVYKVDFTNFDKRIKDSTFIIATDVQSPMIGENGASHMFGPQKGATEKDVKSLEANLTHWANVIRNVTGKELHNMPGAGAAGGLGGAFQAFFPSKMERGIDVVLEYTNLEHELEEADLIITGEGKVDKQTAFGKTPMGVAQAAQKKNVPTIIMTGSIEEGCNLLYDYGVVSINSIMNRPMALEEATKNSAFLLEKSTEQVIRSFFYFSTYNCIVAKY